MTWPTPMNLTQPPFQPKPSGRDSGAGTVRTLIPHIVEISESFGSGWQAIPYLYAESCATALAPNIGVASIGYNYGRIKRPDKTTLTTYPPLNLDDRYIRIRLAQDVIWVGRIVAAREDPFGSRNETDAGMQRWQAYELGHLLDQLEVYGTHVLQGDTLIPIDWIPVMNQAQRDSGSLYGNRSASKRAADEGDGEVYWFSDDGHVWSNYDMVEHLILHVFPSQTDITWAIEGDLAPLKQIKTILDLGALRSGWAILNALIDRKRGLCCSLDATGSKAVIKIHTVLDDDLSIGGITIKKNKDVMVLDLRENIEIAEASVIRSTNATFDRVLAVGEPILACGAFTLREDVGNLEPAWDTGVTGQETEFRWACLMSKWADRANLPEPYDDLNHHEKAVYNDIVRGTETLQVVYTSFRAKDDFADMPICEEDGTFKLAGKLWLHGKRFETWLPFRLDTDYSDADRAQYGELAEVPYRTPFVLARITEEDMESSPDFQSMFMVDDPPPTYVDARAHVLLDDHALGFRIKPASSVVYGLNSFIPGEDDTQWSNYEPRVDYTTLEMVGAFRVDGRVKVAVSNKKEPKKTKIIYVPGAEIWWVNPGTAFELVNGQIVQYVPPASAGEDKLERDDRPRLREIATYALAWYGRPRALVSIAIRRVAQFVKLGAMLKSALQAKQTMQINTIISSIEYDFLQPGGMTRIRTAWQEFDFPDA